VGQVESGLALQIFQQLRAGPWWHKTLYGKGRNSDDMEERELRPELLREPKRVVAAERGKPLRVIRACLP
jgi:hypothetical protein